MPLVGYSIADAAPAATVTPAAGSGGGIWQPGPDRASDWLPRGRCPLLITAACHVSPVRLTAARTPRSLPRVAEIQLFPRRPPKPRRDLMQLPAREVLTSRGRRVKLRRRDGSRYRSEGRSLAPCLPMRPHLQLGVAKQGSRIAEGADSGSVGSLSNRDCCCNKPVSTASPVARQSLETVRQYTSLDEPG
jgi:hypothetical protein